MTYEKGIREVADGYRQVSDDSRVAVVHVREHREIMDRYRVRYCRSCSNAFYGFVARER